MSKLTMVLPKEHLVFSNMHIQKEYQRERIEEKKRLRKR